MIARDRLTVLAFPGQGSQKPAMGAAWVNVASWRLVDYISEWSGVDIAALLLEADETTLKRTDLAQLSVFALSVVAHAEASDRFSDVVACIGHSLGEYTALVAAGVLSLADATRLITARGRAMQAAARARPGTMAVVVGCGTEQVDAVTRCVRDEGHHVWIANINGPKQTVVAGTDSGVNRVFDLARDHDGKAFRIPVGGAFHTPLMADAVDGLSAALRDVSFAAGRVPVVANIDACLHCGDEDWPQLLLRQLTGPVQWAPSVRLLADTWDHVRFVEFGAAVLCGLVKRVDPAIETVSIVEPSDIEAAHSAVRHSVTRFVAAK